MHDTLHSLAETGQPEAGEWLDDPVNAQPVLTIAVVVASLGRPELVSQMVSLMAQQTEQPDALVFSVVNDSDLPDGLPDYQPMRILKGPKGLCSQRNTALGSLSAEYDLVAFYDDDFIPAPDSVARIKAFFATHADVIGATGHVIADGINSAGITYESARSILRDHADADFNPNCIVTDLFGLYGCNMVYRTKAIGSTRFDERLKLYGWQEDIDFAGALRGRGRIVKTFAFSGVHQGVKHGRTPGYRLGYSQVINPAYLARKGTMRFSFALRLVLRNVLANHIKAFRPEPWIDRRGRLRGNWAGFLDLIMGRLTPERIETL